MQVVTGSTGVDDYEWGVTLFAENPDDLKEVVYTMRFDEASAIYADFGPFYTGMISDIDTALVHLGCFSVSDHMKGFTPHSFLKSICYKTVDFFFES